MNETVRNPKAVTNDVVTRGRLPGSRKLIVDGVPFREVALSGGEAPVRLYDTSGPYTDDTAAIDIEKGLGARRREWILARGDVEEYDGRARKPEDDGLKAGELLSVPQFDRAGRRPLARQAGPQRHPASLCASGHHHRGDEVHRRARESRPLRCWRDGNSFGAVDPRRDHAGIRAQRESRAAAPSFRPTSTIPRPSR